MKLNRKNLRKMILAEMAKFRLPSNKNLYAKIDTSGIYGGTPKSQQSREPGPGNIASVTLPPPVDQSADYEIHPDFFHDLLQMYLRAGNFDDAEKLKAKMIRLGIDPEQT